ncbi:MAG: hypothetical protein ACFFAY_13665 [Promethearchaeota archaeon]
MTDSVKHEKKWEIYSVLHSRILVFDMYRNMKGEWERKGSQPSGPSSQLLDSLDSMSFLLSGSGYYEVDRRMLMHHQQMLTNSIEILWRDVQAGRFHVDSIALLRALRDVARYDLGAKLRAPTLENDKIKREIGLIANTVKHVLRPRRIR